MTPAQQASENVQAALNVWLSSVGQSQLAVDGSPGQLTQGAFSRLVAARQAELSAPASSAIPSGVVIATIEGCKYYWDASTSTLTFTGYGRVDDDGLGESHGDRYHQADTSLHLDGHALNADVDEYIVIPLPIFPLIGPKILGSQAYVTAGGYTRPAVVGDAGPNDRSGEGSRALWAGFGVDNDPNSGGINTPTVLYVVKCGIPASVNGVTYQLQSA